MKKILKIMLLAALLLTSACSKNETSEDVLVVGFDDTFAPMGFKDDNGEIVSFDIDLAKEIGEIIGFEFEFQNIDWDLKEAELENGNIDLIWNGYSITSERQEKILFSDPYMENSQIIIVLSEFGIKTKDELVGKTVSVQKNSSAYESVMKDEGFVNSLKDQAVIQYDTNIDCFNDLVAKRSDAIVVDEVLARYYIKQQDNPEIYYILEEDFGDEEYAISMHKDDEELCNKINNALNEIVESGKYDEIYQRWFKK